MAKTATKDVELTEGAINLDTFFEGEDMWADFQPQDFKPLPAGTYNAQITTVEGPILNNAGTAHYMKFPFRITDGEHEGRMVWMNLSLMDSVKWKVQQVFSALGKEPGDNQYIPGEFDDFTCRIKVKVRPARDGYSESNDVERVMPPAPDSSTDADWV